MNCSICRSTMRAAVIETWASNGSLRKTAAKHRVGYRVFNGILTSAWLRFLRRMKRKNMKGLFGLQCSTFAKVSLSRKKNKKNFAGYDDRFNSEFG